MRTDQHRTERSVSGFQCDAGKLDAAPQLLQIDVADDHSPAVYGLRSTRRWPMFGQW
jgi:hypothetical protein